MLKKKLSTFELDFFKKKKKKKVNEFMFHIVYNK